MTMERATTSGLSRTALAAAIALVFASPVYAGDRSSAVESKSADSNVHATRDADDSSYNSRGVTTPGATDDSSYTSRTGTTPGATDSSNSRSSTAPGLTDSSNSRNGTMPGATDSSNSRSSTAPGVTDSSSSNSRSATAPGETDSSSYKSRSATTPDSAKQADNSARNERDRTAGNVTPFDQSHADADVEITRSIREQLVDDDSLSTNAKNVKVVTVDGAVTLRGPVADAGEQARIVAIAKQAAGMGSVVDELEVIQR